MIAQRARGRAGLYYPRLWGVKYSSNNSFPHVVSFRVFIDLQLRTGLAL